MRLETVREALARQVAAAETRHHFEAARERHPALRPFDDPLAAVAFLNDTDHRATSARSAVTRAMIEEVQERGTSCWGALLLYAYFPGLLRIRGSAHRARGLSSEELDLLVLESFLEVAATLPLDRQGRLAVVNLVLGTRKTVFRHLRSEAQRADAERAWPEGIEELVAGNIPSPERLLIRGEAERALAPERIRAWVRELCEDEPEDDLLLVLGTYASGTPLITYVRQVWSEADGEELLRHYERCRRRRSRLLDRLRERIREGRVSHPAFGPALLQQEVWS
jgi:hypothetical protein